MAALYAVLAVLGGVMFVLQTAINAKLGRFVGGPIPATLISFSVGSVVLTIMTFATARTLPSASDLRQVPIYVSLGGGLLGACILSISVFLVPRLGSGATICLVITGQVTAALLLDHLGLFGLVQRDLSGLRIVGAILVAGGALMVRYL